MSDPTVTVLHAKGVLDVDLGDVINGESVVIEGNVITAVTDDATAATGADQVIDLPDLTLVPGLMDMEVDLVLGGRGATLNDPVRMDPVEMGLRAVANGQRTLNAGFTTVRNLGLFIKTGGYLVDVALADAINAGWVEGPRVIPAGHTICPTGGHLDPSAQSGLAPGIMRMNIEEGIADGVSEVRKAVRYQITHGAQLIKCCASGGVMTPTGPPGAQQYSTEELTAIADEAHRRGLRVATHAHGDQAVNAALDAGIDCIEHGMMITDDTIQRMVDTGNLPGLHLHAHRELGHLRPAEVAPGQGRRGVPAGQGIAHQGDREWREGRPRHRRARHLPRTERRGARGPRAPGHDPHPGDPLRHHRGRGPHRPPRARPHRPRDARRHHRRDR